jgi:hypothetical protein
MDVPGTKTPWVDRRWFERLLEIFPGFITWSFIVGPIVLAWFHPLAVAYFIIAFDLVWLIKSFRLSYYLIHGYSVLRRSEKVRWLDRLKELEDLDKAIAKTERTISDLVAKYPRALSWFPGDPKSLATRSKYKKLLEHRSQLLDLQARQSTLLNPADVYNAVILATYNETMEILEPSIQSLTASDYPLDHIMLIIAYEERGGAETAKNAKYLIEKYGPQFAYAKAIEHPDGIPGEAKAKGANITYACRQLTEYVTGAGIDPEHVIITTLDSDHRPSKNYFSLLTYVYATNINRVHQSYQPIPMFFNNIWDVPAPMRLIATGSSFWQIMESMRPHRLRNFAAHAQSLKALIDVDYWSLTSIVEDGHQYWRSYFAFDGDHQVVPLFTPVYQDAVLADGYLQTFKAQYLQLRRWSWGVSEFPFVVRNAIKNTRIGFVERLVQIWRLFEGHFSWATAPLILTFVAWLPLYVNRSFSDQLLAHQLPVIASRIMTLSMLGLLVTVTISLISLPPKPKRYHGARSIIMVLQWGLLPLTTIVFSALPAIDSHTRLMLGRYLDFRVTEKARKK